MKYLDSMKVKKSDDWLEVALACNKENVDLLKALKIDVVKEFSLYDDIINAANSKPNPSKLSMHKDLLVHYYQHPPAKLGRLLIARRNDHCLLECPFCGNPAAPDTLDHFIPKDEWPEFSINPNNLVPQCRGCAPVKGSKYFCETSGTSLYLHPFYSDLPSKFKFKISANLSVNSGKVFFCISLKKPKSVDDNSTQIVIRHFKELNLIKRIQFYCHREFNKWKQLLIAKQFDIEGALQIRLSERQVDEHGKDWKTALYIGVLDNKDVINYLNSFGNKSLITADQEPEEEISL